MSVADAPTNFTGIASEIVLHQAGNLPAANRIAEEVTTTGVYVS